MTRLRRVADVEGEVSRSRWEDKVYVPVAALGLAAVMFSLAVGSAIGLYVGDFIGPPDAGDQTRLGVISATSAWNPQVLFFGASMLMVAVLFVLRWIIKTLRANGRVLQEELPKLIQTPGGGR